MIDEIELLKKQEETFERMAFKLAEERELLIKCLGAEAEACYFCEHGEEDPECEFADYMCFSCSNKKCPCHDCHHRSNFIFSAERAKKSLERFEGK
jgi:hypothetical protein